MIPFNHMLVPTDFSKAAGLALDLAMTLGAQFGSKLTLLHAYALPMAAQGDGLVWPVGDFRRAAEQALDAALSDARRRYGEVDAMLVEGNAWRQILDAAEACDIDLVVMGTHGRRGLSHALLGSVTERVVRTSRVPVLTVSAADA